MGASVFEFKRVQEAVASKVVHAVEVARFEDVE